MITHPELGLLALEVEGRHGSPSTRPRSDGPRRATRRTHVLDEDPFHQAKGAMHSLVADPRGPAGLGTVEAELRVRRGVPRRARTRRAAHPGAPAEIVIDRDDLSRLAERVPRGDAVLGAPGATVRRGGDGRRRDGARVPRRGPHAAEAAVRRGGQEDRRAHDGSGVGARVRAPSAPRGRDRSGGKRQDAARDLRSPSSSRRAGIGRCSRASTAGSATISRVVRGRGRGDRRRDVPRALRPAWRGRPGSTLPPEETGPGSPYLRAPAPRGARRGRDPARAALRRDRGRRGAGLPRVVVARAALAPDGSRRRARCTCSPTTTRTSTEAASCRSKPEDRVAPIAGEPPEHEGDRRVRARVFYAGEQAPIGSGPEGGPSRSSATSARRISSTCSRSCSEPDRGGARAARGHRRARRRRARTRAACGSARDGRRLPPVRDRRAGHRPATSVHAFKGLERPVVILAELGEKHLQDLQQYLYVGGSQGEEPPHRPGHRTRRARAPEGDQRASPVPETSLTLAGAWRTWATSAPTASAGRCTAR